MNRLSVNALLKSVVGIPAAAIVVALLMGAWDSWNRFSAASRLAQVAVASSNLFTGLHNLRVDRSQSTREPNADKVG